MTALSDAAKEYLAELDASGLAHDRTNYFIGIYESLFPSDTFQTVFISDTRDEDGTASLDTLWLIGPFLVAECKNFQLEDRFDSAALGKIKHWQVISADYIPGRETAASRMTLVWTNSDGISGTMSATGGNCAHLTSFVRTHLVPHQVSAPAGPAQP